LKCAWAQVGEYGEAHTRVRFVEESSFHALARNRKGTIAHQGPRPKCPTIRRCSLPARVVLRPRCLDALETIRRSLCTRSPRESSAPFTAACSAGGNARGKGTDTLARNPGDRRAPQDWRGTRSTLLTRRRFHPSRCEAFCKYVVKDFPSYSSSGASITAPTVEIGTSGTAACSRHNRLFYHQPRFEASRAWRQATYASAITFADTIADIEILLLITAAFFFCCAVRTIPTRSPRR